MNYRPGGELKDHIVVCGYDDVVDHVVKELTRKGEKCLVVAEDLEDGVKSELSDKMVGFVEGDPTSSEVLRNRAQVDNAKSVIAATKSMEDNVFASLTVGNILKGQESEDSPNPRIISRVGHIDDEVRKKFNWVYTDAVISPSVVGGYLLADASTNPFASRFLQDAMTEAGQVQLDEYELDEGSPLVGMTIGQMFKNVVSEYSDEDETSENIRVLAVGTGHEGREESAKAGAGTVPLPSEGFTLEEGHVLVLIGKVEREGSEIKRDFLEIGIKALEDFEREQRALGNARDNQ